MPYTDPNNPEMLRNRPEEFRIRVMQLTNAGANVFNRVRVPEEAEVVPQETPNESPSLAAFHERQATLEQLSAVDAARLLRDEALAEQARNN